MCRGTQTRIPLDVAMPQVCFFVPELTSVLMVECFVDSLVGNRVPILVTSDALLAGNIMKLLTSADSEDSDVTYTITPASKQIGVSLWSFKACIQSVTRGNMQECWGIGTG